VAGDLLEIEQLARRSPRANPGMAVTVVRPAALVFGLIGQAETERAISHR